MHAALDGEATPEEVRALEDRLADDAAARAQFAELQRMFDGLARVPQRFPPEGLVAAVMANLPAIESSRTGADQLFSPSGVIDANTGNVRGSIPGKRAGVDRGFPLWAFLRGDTMNEKTSGSGKRKILIDVPLRIDDCGDVCRFIADEIRRVGEAIQVELLDEHPPYDTPSPSIRCRRSA